MKRNTVRLGAVLMAVMLVLLAPAGAAAAATWDGETTNSGTTSDVSGTSTTITFERGNSSTATWFEVDSASTSNLALELTPAEPGLDTVVYRNASAETTNASTGNYAWNVTHDELEDLPATANKGTYNATVVDTENDTVVVSGEVVFDQSHKNQQTVVMWVTDNSGTDAATMTDLVADTLSTETEESTFWFDNEYTTYSSFTQIDGTNSTTEVHLKNTTVRNAMDNESEGLESGDLIRNQQLHLNSGPTLMYYQDAPDDVETSTTYATYDDSTGVVTINHGDDFDGINQMHISATAGDGYDFSVAKNHFGWGLAFDLSWVGDIVPLTTMPGILG